MTFRKFSHLGNRPARIYVAGPYTHGDLMVNVRRVVDAANSLLRYGYAPFIPHTMTMLWQLVHEHPATTWYELDNIFLKSCDAILRTPGRSAGSDDEVSLARAHNIPVFFELTPLRHHFEFPEQKELFQ